MKIRQHIRIDGYYVVHDAPARLANGLPLSRCALRRSVAAACWAVLIYLWPLGRHDPIVAACPRHNVRYLTRFHAWLLPCLDQRGSRPLISPPSGHKTGFTREQLVDNPEQLSF